MGSLLEEMDDAEQAAHHFMAEAREVAAPLIGTRAIWDLEQCGLVLMKRAQFDRLIMCAARQRGPHEPKRKPPPVPQRQERRR
jgi:hypothetical protein